MYEAFVGELGYVLNADDYEDLSREERASLAETLSCTACEQPAYFIRRARNGRAACFGARPHLENCELASTLTEDGGFAQLSEEEQRISARDIFVLRPVEYRGSVRHVRHDPSESPGTGVARRFTLVGGEGVSTPSLGLAVLLRRLLREPELQNSRAKLVLPNGLEGTIRTQCVDIINAGLRYNHKRHLYWGTIRSARQQGDRIWLNLGRWDAPTLGLTLDFADALLDHAELDDLEDLQGCSFITFSYLNKAKAEDNDRLFLFPDDLDWFALRRPEGDPI